MSDVEAADAKILLPIVVGVWILVAVLLEFAFADGDSLRAVVRGFVGGIAFALVYLVVRRRKGD